MFTGIIEEIGYVISLVKSDSVLLWDGTVGEGYILTIRCKTVLDGAYLGCSIAVNGTCLTVTSFTEDSFTVGCAPETMRKTNLIDLKEASPVNLERSMAADARNSGHFVQGHVDGTGRIIAFWREGDSLWVKIATSSAILRYIVPKGYIAVDGTSLTVCEVARPGSAAAVEAGCKAAQQDGQDGEGYFTFMLIAYTQAHIILPRKALGETVNLEADVMGKYAESAVANSTAAMQAALAAMVQQVEERLSSSIAKIDERLSAVEARVSKLQ